MTFVSFEFLIFLCVTFALYYILGRTARLQLAILVLMSALFYAWDNPKSLVLLVGVSLIASLSSMAIARESDPSVRAVVFGSSVVVMLGVLGYFKYGGLFFSTLVGPGRMPDWERFFVNIPLPVGISFYVFHSISLLADVRRKTYELPRELSVPDHMLRSSLYIAFFPQLVAGPIMKARDFFPQIGRKSFSKIDWLAAFRLLTLGYFLKMVLADNLAVQTQAMAYPYFENYPSSRLLALLIGYSCQIFSDFFGYSLIAMGLATLFGYRLPVNFNRPYVASSFSDFWHRWHMSLSAWLRDYLYVPLGGSRRGIFRTYVNLFIVMFLGGLWHGGAWSYAIWGTMHGAALAAERPFLHSKLMLSEHFLLKAIRICFVFTVVSVAWLFFRFQNESHAFAYLASMVRNIDSSMTLGELSRVYIYCLPVFLYHLLPVLRVSNFWRSSRWVYAAMLVAIALNHGVPGAFIYFQF